MVDYPFKRFSDYDFAKLSFLNAYDFNISNYDAQFISVASFQGAPLLTADQDLVRACRKNGFSLVVALQEL